MVFQSKMIVSGDPKRLEWYNISIDPHEQLDLVQRETEL
jgi:hypothetical protein